MTFLTDRSHLVDVLCMGSYQDVNAPRLEVSFETFFANNLPAAFFPNWLETFFNARSIKNNRLEVFHVRAKVKRCFRAIFYKLMEFKNFLIGPKIDPVFAIINVHRQNKSLAGIYLYLKIFISLDRTKQKAIGTKCEAGFLLTARKSQTGVVDHSLAGRFVFRIQNRKEDRHASRAHKAMTPFTANGLKSKSDPNSSKSEGFPNV